MTSSIDNFAIFLSLAIASLTIASSVYDIFIHKLGAKSVEALKIFSIQENVKQLIKINRSDSVIGCIDGIKAISAIWIVAGHRRYMIDTGKLWEGWNPFRDGFMKFVDQFTFCVVTFFVCSGILVTHSILRSLERGSFNILKAYINRYIRLIPIAGLLILFSFTSFLKDIDPFNFFKEKCETEWLKALLMYQNYNKGRFCFDHTWYLSADFQLFLVSPLFIYFLKKTRKVGILLLILIIITLEIVLFQKLKNERFQGWWWTYVETHFRLGEFLIGVITGFVMYNRQKSENIQELRPLNTQVHLFGWILSLGFLWFHIFKSARFPMANSQRLIYNSVNRDLWACSISWIVFACQSLKSGGIIRSFLSHPFWQPLSKLTLSMYLLHMPYLIYTKVYYQDGFGIIWLLNMFAGDVFISTFAAACAYVLIECPVGKLVDLMWKVTKKPAMKSIEEKMPLIQVH